MPSPESTTDSTTDSPLGPRAQLDGAAGRGVAKRVGEQVFDRLLDAIRIRRHLVGLVVNRDADRDLPAARLLLVTLR